MFMVRKYDVGYEKNVKILKIEKKTCMFVFFFLIPHHENGTVSVMGLDLKSTTLIINEMLYTEDKKLRLRSYITFIKLQHVLFFFPLV